MATSFLRQGVIRKAWQATWSNKILWFFGLFAAILSFGEEYDLLVRNGDILDSIPQRLAQYRAVAEGGTLAIVWHDITEALRANIPGTLWLLLLFAVTILALAWIVMVSQAALIEGSRRNDDGKRIGILGGFDVGMSKFWSMFSLNVIMKVFVYGSLFLVVVPSAYAYIRYGNHTAGLIAVLWTFLILLPVITVISFLTKFAMSYIVLHDYRAWQAIVASWKLFLKHWLVSIELAILLILINFVIVYTAATTLFYTFIVHTGTQTGFVVFLILMAAIIAILTTFQFAAWTMLFLRIEQGAAPSKLRRLVHYLLDMQEHPSKPAQAKIAK